MNVTQLSDRARIAARPWTGWTLLLGLLVLLAAPPAPAQDVEAELAQLQERFKERRPALTRLKDALKVGETTEGLVALVEPRHGAEVIDPDAEEGQPRTVSELLAAENQDRERLYALLAQKLGEPPAEVAVQNAIRNFQKAKPEHYLRLRDGSWMQKEDVVEEAEERGGAG